jgi:hypothetical protein
MKINTIAILLCLGALASITSLKAYATTSSGKTVTEAISDKTKTAIEEIKHYSADKKEIASTKAKAIIADIDSRIKALEDTVADKTNNMSDAMRDAKIKTIVKLKEQKQNLQDWYQKFHTSSKDAWEEIKQGFIRSYNSFEYTYKNS